MRHLLSLSDLVPESLSFLVNRSSAIAGGDHTRSLEGKIVGIYFRKSSTRTRTSFTVGAMRLGAQVISYGPQDLQIVTGETMRDTARVLSGFLDALVVRTNESQAEMQTLANQDRMAVVNAMSESEHPTQAIADLSVMYEALGDLRDVHILYLGEGNNTAAALALAVGRTPGMRLTLVTPKGYGLDDRVMRMAIDAPGNSVIEQHHDMDRLPTAVDVVYTTRWQTMGEPKADANWRALFEPYRVTPEVLARVSRSSRTIFLHDLPAIRGAEVAGEVLDGPQSWAFRQAEHKLFSAMAVLEWCVAEETTNNRTMPANEQIPVHTFESGENLVRAAPTI